MFDKNVSVSSFCSLLSSVAAAAEATTTTTGHADRGTTQTITLHQASHVTCSYNNLHVDLRTFRTMSVVPVPVVLVPVVPVPFACHVCIPRQMLCVTPCVVPCDGCCTRCRAMRRVTYQVSCHVMGVVPVCRTRCRAMWWVLYNQCIVPCDVWSRPTRITCHETCVVPCVVPWDAWRTRCHAMRRVSY
jgi:hypothetical protein